VTSLRLIKRRGRLEFKADRDAALYRSQTSGGPAYHQSQPWSRAGSPAGRLERLIP
jgi:hypothetical protein